MTSRLQRMQNYAAQSILYTPQHSHTFIITSLASCSSKEHLQNSLRHHMSLICRRRIHHTPATIAPAHAPCLFSMDLHTVRKHLMIAPFILFLLFGTLFQMKSGCAPSLSFQSCLKTYLFRSVYKDKTFFNHCTCVKGY